MLPLLEYDIKIPVFNDKDKKFVRINEFYKNLASECIKYAEGELTQKSAADYVSSTDPKKRYRYKKFLYSFGYLINFNEIKFAEIKISIRVSAGNEVKFSREFTHRWNLEYLLIMPPEKTEKKKAVKQRHHIQQ